MEPRIEYLRVARGIYEAMLGLEKYLHQGGLEESLIKLVKLRTSQINGCAYCILEPDLLHFISEKVDRIAFARETSAEGCRHGWLQRNVSIPPFEGLAKGRNVLKCTAIQI